MKHSDSIANIAAALANASAEIENPRTTSVNPHYRSRYADLAEIVNTVRPVLAKHGLAVVQAPGMENGNVIVDTLLIHASGEWIMGRASSPLPKADPQGVGSAVTYLRRYSLAAMLGLAQEDDDGHAASNAAFQSNGNARANGSVTTGPSCPVCDGPMYDNRTENENRKAKGLKARPAFKCKKQGCKGLYWDDPATTEQTPEGDAAEKDRMLAGIEAMIGELSGLNADRADKVQAALDDLIATENVTTDALRKFGSHVKTALDQEKAAAVTVAADEEDLPF